ncbi:hypothetical protein [Scytonema sp. PCC 10023]|jgi:hypothetical protein|uniref:hypothetical protein n=1 Tax=Scytonema sp. PCC 10023 TaxID=1680591 RepID=UPI0039C61B8C
MSGQTRKRLNLTLRYTPYADSPDGVVLSYLNCSQMRVLKKTVLETLSMCWLALAYQERGNLPPEELRLVALGCVDALEKHISYLRAAFRLESPTVQNSTFREVMAPVVYASTPPTVKNISTNGESREESASFEGGSKRNLYLDSQELFG